MHLNGKIEVSLAGTVSVVIATLCGYFLGSGPCAKGIRGQQFKKFIIVSKNYDNCFDFCLFENTQHTAAITLVAEMFLSSNSMRKLNLSQTLTF